MPSKAAVYAVHYLDRACGVCCQEQGALYGLEVTSATRIFMPTRMYRTSSLCSELSYSLHAYSPSATQCVCEERMLCLAPDVYILLVLSCCMSICLRDLFHAGALKGRGVCCLSFSCCSECSSPSIT